MEATTKIQNYIDYRMKSEQKMMGWIELEKEISKVDLYVKMYGDRDVKCERELGLLQCNFKH